MSLVQKLINIKLVKNFQLSEKLKSVSRIPKILLENKITIKFIYNKKKIALENIKIPNSTQKSSLNRM
jgi:hypothetical protein